MAIEELQNGRYHHVRLLGSGGMGEVHLMQDKRVGRQVAIKILRAEGSFLVDDEKIADAARLFQREARAIAALEHPNILPLYDFGEETVEGVTMTYMVMPYCADGSLEEWLRQRTGRSLTPAKVAALIEQAAEALQHAHEHKIIHLDVKPSNFLLRGNRRDRDRPTLLLADFGIARSFTTVSSSSRTIRGTPVSMAPEQWSGSPVFASDQYALAIMAYEMLAGRPPFVGSMEQLMYKHFTAPAPAPSQFNKHLPVEIDEVLQRALAKKTEERYPSIVDFALALVEGARHAVERPERIDEKDAAAYATLATNSQEAETIIEPAQKEAAEISRERMDGEEAVTSAPLEASQEAEAIESAPVEVQHGAATRSPDADEATEQKSAVLVDIAVEPAQEEDSASARKTPETPPIRLPASSRSEAAQPVVLSASDHDLPTLATVPSEVQITGAPVALPARLSRRRLGLIAFLSLLVVIVLAGGSIALFANRQPTSSAHSGLPATSTPVVHVTPTTAQATPTPSVGPGEYVAGTYNGSLQDPTTGTHHLSVVLTQTQGSGALSGSVTIDSSPQQMYPLTGSIDPQGDFHFTATPSSGLPYYFSGSIQQNGQGEFLRGNFCRTSGSACPPTSGYFTVGPRY